MSSLASQLNKGHGNNPFKVDASKFDFINLESLFNKDGENTKYKLLGVYINKKGRFGAEPVAIIDSFKVNLPKHLLDDVQLILDSDEMVLAILEGRLGFQIEPYTNARGKFYSIHWVDLELEN